MKDRRSELRFMCADLVKLCIRSEGESRQELVANLEDISPSGACVQLDAAVREGTAVEIVCGRCRFRGKVRHCRYVATGYDVGVQFARPKSWDQKRYRPKHLLEIPEAVRRAADRP